MDFVEGNVQVTGRPEGWRCLEKDVSKVEEILGITNTLEKHQNKVKEAFKDPIKKANLIDKSYEWLKMLFEQTGTLTRTGLEQPCSPLHPKIYDPSRQL